MSAFASVFLSQTKNCASLTPPGPKTSVGFEVVVPCDPLMNQCSICQRGAQSNGLMYRLESVPMPGQVQEGFHYSLWSGRRRSPQAFSQPICDSALLSCHHLCLTCHPSRLIRPGRVASTFPLLPISFSPPSLLFSSLLFSIFLPLQFLSLPPSVSCSLSGPYTAYVTITKSSRIAAAIA